MLVRRVAILSRNGNPAVSREREGDLDSGDVRAEGTNTVDTKLHSERLTEYLQLQTGR